MGGVRGGGVRGGGRAWWGACVVVGDMCSGGGHAWLGRA